MTEPYRIEIHSSKGKLFFFLLICIVFIALGYWMLAYHPHVSNSLFDNPFVKGGAGVLGILMGLSGIYVFIRKLISKEPAVIIEDSGITNNSSGASLGKISWEDIIDIQITTVQVSAFNKHRFIAISVRDPEEYINRVKNVFARKALLLNQSLVNISLESLDIPDDEVISLVFEKWEEYKASQS